MKILINKSAVLLCVFLVSLTFFACKKDKLIDDLEVFKGRYTWSYTYYFENWWDSSYKIFQASNADYKAEIEFNDQGKIIFYIDGVEIHKTGFSIENQELIGNGQIISLSVDPFHENSKNLDLNDKIGFSISGDTLNVDDFPGESYDRDFGGSHYFIRN